MSVLTVVLVVLVGALAIAAVGCALGMLVAPPFGRWAEPITDDDDDD